jgi:hypothetical protein
MADQNTAPTVEPSTHTPVVGGVDETVDAKRVSARNFQKDATFHQLILPLMLNDSFRSVNVFYQVFIGNVSFTSTQEQVEEFVKQGGGSV